MITVPGVLLPMEVIGVIMVCGAVMTYGIPQYRNKSVGITGVVLAVITDCFIASYSIIDAAGARIAQSAIGFYGASTTENGAFLALYLYRFHPTGVDRVYRDAPRTLFIGGNASYIAYVAVLWAYLSAPVGVVLLKEKMTFYKTAIILIILCGVIVLRMA